MIDGDGFGIVSAEVFGGAHLGILSEEAFGIGEIPVVIVGEGFGIVSAEALGVGDLFDSILGEGFGIVSLEAFGIGQIPVVIVGEGFGIVSAEALGVGILTEILDARANAGISSAEALGLGAINQGPIIGGFGILSEQVFGTGGALLSAGDLPPNLPENRGVFVVYHAGKVVGACANGEALYGVKVNTLSISRQLNFNATASYELYDKDGTTLPTQGQDVQIYCYDRLLSVWVRIFGGQIETATIEPRADVIGRIRECVYNINCISYGQALVRRIVQAKFAGASFGTFNSIMTFLQTTMFVQEGISWVPTADPGVVLGDLDFTNGAPLNDVLDTLCEATNQSWQLDWDKYLYTSGTPTGTVTAPRSITETDQNFRNLQIVRNRGLYRNRQIVIGASTKTSKRMTATYVIPFGLQGPPFGEAWAYFGTAWDSSTQTFATVPALYLYDHRWDNRVEKIISIKVNGVPDVFYTVPTSGIADPADIPAGWKWWTFAPSMNMVRNMGLPPGSEPQPGNTVTIEFDLVGEVPQPIIVEDSVEIANRKAVEGGSGIYEDIQRLPEIDDPATLREYAEGLLAKFGTLGLEVNTETDYLGLEPGMTQVINLPSFGLAATSGIIESVNMRDISGRLPRTTVKVANRIQQQDALTAMQRLIRRLKTPARGTKSQITFVLAQDIPGLTNFGLATGSTVTNSYLLRQEFTLVEVAIFFQSEPSGGSITINILADGVSILTAPAVYDKGTRTFTNFVSAPRTLAKGTKLTLDVLSVGALNAGKNGTVTVIGWV